MKQTLLEIDPKNIADWLTRLPYAQPGRAAKLLVDALLILSETPLKPELRLQLTQLYSEATEQLARVAEQSLALDEITSSVEAQALATLTLTALNEVYTNWRVCLDEQSASRGWFKRDQAKVEILDHALSCALSTLIWAKQNYLPLPRGFWLDCHALYRSAAERGWVRNGKSKSEAHQLYQQLLLLGLTDTHRLTEEHIRWLRLTLPELAAKVQLQPVQAMREQRGSYLVDTNTDCPPRFMHLPPKTNTESWLWLNLDEAIANLGGRQAALENSEPEESVIHDELELTQKLAQDWSQPQRRRHNRTESDSGLEIISQLPAIWYALNGSRWQPLGEQESLARAVRRTPAPPSTMRVVNQSPIGLMLRGTPEGHSLRAGDILLAQRDQAGIGVFFVRWLSLQAERLEVECGVERLSQDARPAEAMPSITHSGDAFQLALLLPGEPKLGVSERLLMAGRPFGRLKELRLRDELGERLVRLTRVVNQSPYYQIMEFRLSEDF
jgi:hypothetical protein